LSLQLYEKLFGYANRRSRGAVDRSSLPSPASYLAQRGLLTRQGRRSYAEIHCPEHKSGEERHPSMLVDLTDGFYKCQACGAKGGDIIALHRLITGLGFNEAVQDLGGRFYD
jgi:DNA primase